MATDKELEYIRKDICPKCKAIHPFFTGPKGGEAQMFICDNCHLEITNYIFTAIINGHCCVERCRSAYSSIPSMQGENVVYKTHKGVIVERMTPVHARPGIFKRILIRLGI